MDEDEFMALPLGEKMKLIPENDKEVVDIMAESIEIELSMLKDGLSDELWLDFWEQIGYRICNGEEYIGDEIYQICQSIRRGHINSKDVELHNTDSFKMESVWGLSHANYLTLPRSIIQEMPIEWQDTLAGLLNELGDTVESFVEEGQSYWVELGEESRKSDEDLKEGEEHIKFTDKLMEYRHGNDCAKALFKKKEKSDE